MVYGMGFVAVLFALLYLLGRRYRVDGFAKRIDPWSLVLKISIIIMPTFLLASALRILSPSVVMFFALFTASGEIGVGNSIFLTLFGIALSWYTWMVVIIIVLRNMWRNYNHVKKGGDGGIYVACKGTPGAEQTKYGFVTKYGAIVVPIIYEGAGDFFEGMAPVYRNGKWGYINAKAEIAIDFKYDRAEPFSDGRAEVSLADEVFYIDKAGKRCDDVPAQA